MKLSDYLFYEDDWATIYCGDCLQIMPLMEPESVDLVVTDPPYGIKYHRTTRSKGNITVNYAGGIYGKQWDEIFGDDHEFDPSPLFIFKNLILWGANHYCQRLPWSTGWLVWDKKRGGTTAQNFTGSDVELAWSNVVTISKIFSYLWDGFKRDGEVGDHFHPVQKPIALMEWCIKFVPTAKIILDPFIGSGTTLIAAKNLNRKSIGIEINPKYCTIAAKRLRQEVFDFRKTA